MADQVYTIVDLRVAPLIPWRDVLLAELTELGYDSFEETLDGLRAFVLEGDFDAPALEATTVFALPGGVRQNLTPGAPELECEVGVAV